jgi:hypothetical protein
MAELGEGLEDRDSSGFFSVLPQPPSLLGGLTILTEAVALARRIPGDVPQAAAIRAIISATERNVAEAGVAAVKASEDAAIETLARTKVRPESGDLGAHRKRLAEGIQSEVLGLGAVGIGSIEELDTVVGTDGRPFWRTQEYGSDHNVGRIVFGLFQPGDSQPDQGEFRVHPVFVPGEGGAMIIRRPIPARHFLRAGTAAASLLRERQFGEAEAVAISQMRAVRSSLI